MHTIQSYTHLPISSLEYLLDTAIRRENYEKAQAIKEALERVVTNSTISFLPNGNMKLAPTFEEVIQYWHKGKIIFSESVEGVSLDSVRHTKGLLAYERNIKIESITTEIGLRRKI